MDNEKDIVEVTDYGMDEIYDVFYKCKSCGCEDILRNARFCPGCGGRIIWEDEKVISE